MAIPRRDDVLARFERGQRLGWFLEIALFLIAVGLLPFIHWPKLQQDWIAAVVAVCLVPMQFLPSFVYVLAIKKKEIDDLSETARFGVFDKHLLRQLVDTVLKDLQIPKRKVRVFVTNEKQLNAFAVSFGLSRFFPFLRGIYLNRKTLHLTTPQELKHWIGHELGHLFPYALRLDQAALLQIIAGSVLSLFAYQQIGPLNGFGFIATVGIAWLFLYITSLPRAPLSQVCELLCDEYGTRASGIEVAITDLLKVGSASEADFDLLMYVTQAARNGEVPTEEAAFRIYEQTLGFEAEDIEQTKKRVKAAMKEHRQSQPAISVSGLLDFFWRDPSNDSERAEKRDSMLRVYELLQNVPRADWKSITRWDGKSTLTTLQINALVQELLADPDLVLFRIPDEFQVGEAKSHPSFKKRILYLWTNQTEILNAPLARF